MRSTEINWSELRAAAIAIGVREAGRQASSHLPRDEQERFVQRVMKRSQREGWIKQTQSLTVQTTQAKPLSANVRTGSEAIESRLSEDGKETKLSLSKGVRRLAKHIETLDESLLYAGADKVKHTVGAASQIHGWEKEEEGAGTLSGLRVYSKQTIVQVQQKQ